MGKDNNAMRKLYQEALGTEPHNINGLINTDSFYFAEKLFEIAAGRIKITCPDWWSKEFIRNLLLTKGVVYFYQSPAGVAPTDGASSGVNVFGEPTMLCTTNPIWTSKLADLNVYDVKLSNEVLPEKAAVDFYFRSRNPYRGWMSMINHYAYKLASWDATFNVACMNLRPAFIFNAANEKQKASAEKMYDDITAGKPAVFVRSRDVLKADDDGSFTVEYLPVKQNMILQELIEVKRNIMSDFLTEIGVSNVQFEKKERLVSDEVFGNQDEVENNVKIIEENLKRNSERVRKAFPEIDFDISLERGVLNVEQEETQNNDKDSDNNNVDGGND